MQRTLSLAAGALAAALLLGGPGGGTTTAAWRDEVVLDAGTITAGQLDVSLSPADPHFVPDTVTLGSGSSVTVSYVLTTTLRGDNIDGRLTLSVRGWAPHPLLDVLRITAQVTQGGSTVAETMGPDGTFQFDVDAFPFDPSYGVATFTVDLTIKYPAAAGNAYPGQELSPGRLVADLRQIREGGTSQDGLWSAQAEAPTPGVRPYVLIQSRAPEAAESASPSSDETSGLDSPEVVRPAADSPASGQEPGTEPPTTDGAPGGDGSSDLTAVPDPNVSPAPIEDRAEENDVDLDEVVAWLERRQG